MALDWTSLYYFSMRQTANFLAHSYNTKIQSFALLLRRWGASCYVVRSSANGIMSFSNSIAQFFTSLVVMRTLKSNYTAPLSKGMQRRYVHFFVTQAIQI